MMVTIEEWTIRGHVVEHAIQHNADAHLIGMFDEVLPILQCAEVSIYIFVILRVIRVIGAGIEDRVEVDRIYTQRFQIRQILIHTSEIATHIIAAARLLLGGAAGWRCFIKAPRAIRIAIGIVTAVSFGQGSPEQ